MCGAVAGKSGKTLVIDHAKRAGDKIRISGGGRCNFTNIHTSAQAFLSQNPHFAKSALARYTPWDFIDLISRHGLTYHEKTLGQLFCDQKSGAIIQVLLDELSAAGADLWLETQVGQIERTDQGFSVNLEREGKAQKVTCDNLVVATGGKSIPKMGATGLGYDIARQFGLPIVETRPGLVPFTFTGDMLENMAARSGVSVAAEVACAKARFAEGLLFTHRGLSGPSMLQVSSYWDLGEELVVNFAEGANLAAHLRSAKSANPKKTLSAALSPRLPAAAQSFLIEEDDLAAPLQNLSLTKLDEIAQQIQAARLRPAGTEGYRTAEVTVGGVDTAALSSKSMEAKDYPGLYFIGEVVDVTGWLGGYNFQWAWASAATAGRAIAASSL